jgi:hypothetical protein
MYGARYLTKNNKKYTIHLFLYHPLLLTVFDLVNNHQIQLDLLAELKVFLM